MSEGAAATLAMNTSRLEAFSDGVIAILITIMVLELRTPAGADWPALRHLAPQLCPYALSFVFLGIYWSNHHHMFQLTDHVTGGVLWANLHLLFWLSLVPFTTAWVGDTHLAPVPTAVYGVILVLAAIAYTMLQTVIIRSQGPHSRLRAAIGSDAKGKVSIVLYASAIVLAFIAPWISGALYVVVALIWLVPDRRIEREVHQA
jgi:uncharacterized membrane protein